LRGVKGTLTGYVKLPISLKIGDLKLKVIEKSEGRSNACSLT
jgi:hypothetical protein